MTYGRSSSHICSDQVAAAIETRLRSMGTVRQAELRVDSQPPVFRVGFGDVDATGENYDIAFVRLAMKLLDDVRFASSLRDALSAPMAANAGS